MRTRNYYLILVSLLCLIACVDAKIKAPDISQYKDRITHEKTMRRLQLDICKSRGELNNYTLDSIAIVYEYLFKVYSINLSTVDGFNNIIEEGREKVKNVDTIFTSNGIPILTHIGGSSDSSKINLQKRIDINLSTIDSLDNVIGYKQNQTK